MQVRSEDSHGRLQQLQDLPRQGHMIRSSTPTSATLWAEAVQHLPDDKFKFALNAAHDTLPHNANLHMWGKKGCSTCPLCQKEPQTLVHVLNCCTAARDLRRYNERHDGVLRVIYDSIRDHLSDTTSASADLGHTYTFPNHTVPTDLRPDIVVWDDSTKEVYLVELTVCFDTLFEEAIQRKESRYCDLVDSIRQEGYTAELITLEVGARGLRAT